MTRIGYQSGGGTIATGADKTAYLEAIANGPAYGAQYIELFPSDLSTFVGLTTTSTEITWNGISNYGTSLSQNINMLAQALEAAQTNMATNATNSASGTLCPLPLMGATYLPWTYP